MNKQKQKLMAMLLIVAMLFTLVPAPVFAETTGDGSEPDTPVTNPVYTVSFDANNGSGSMQPVQVTSESNYKYTLPENGFTAPDGQRFVGWATEQHGAVIRTGTIDVTQDTTLYAVWELEPDNEQTSISVGDTVIISDGYWKYGSSYNSQDPDGYIITGGGSSEAISVTITGGDHNITLSGFKISHTNNFTVSGGNVDMTLEGTENRIETSLSVSGTGSLTINENSSGSLYANVIGGGTIIINGGKINANSIYGTVTINGGWFASGNTNDNKVCGVAVANGKHVVQTNLTDYPYYVSSEDGDTFTVTFEANGGGDSMTSASATKGNYTLPACTFTAPAEGKVFKGWSMSNGGEVITEKSILVLTNNITLWANWEDAGIAIDTTNFPNAAFRDYVSKKFDTTPNGYLSPTEIAAATEIDVKNKGITTLKGLEYFTALTDLICSENPLGTLDLSANTALVELECISCQLTELNISNNTNLTGLWIQSNPITELDLSKNTKLNTLFIDGTQLTSLDINNTQLIRVTSAGSESYISYPISPNNDNTLDLRTLPGNFDVTKASNWDGGSVSGNILTIEDGLHKVTYTYDCGRDVEVGFELRIEIPAVDVEINETNFPDVNFRSYVSGKFDTNKDDILSVAEASSVTSIQNGSEEGETLYNYMKQTQNMKGIEYFTELRELGCFNCAWTSLDISQNQKLTYLSCNQNQLSSLDVSKNRALTTLECKSNNLTTLDVSKNKALINLYCEGNNLTDLAVSKNINLKELTVGGTSSKPSSLTSLDVSKNTALTKLNVQYCQVTHLDLSNNKALTHMDFRNNQLTSLDISGITEDNPVVVIQNNTYNITVGTDGKFELGSLPGNFDVSKASGWTGGAVEGTTLTVNENATEVTYTYDCGKGKSATFTLNVKPGTTYTVTLNAKDGTGDAIMKPGVSGNYTLPACPDTFTAPTGKQFAGWAYENGTIITDKNINVTANTTLYAVWEAASHTHAYDQKVVAEKYLATAATCKEAATYYKSCECGEKGAETFTNGDVNPANHTGTATDIVNNNNGTHDVTYTCCNAVANNDVACTYENNKCTVCGYTKPVVSTETTVTDITIGGVQGTAGADNKIAVTLDKAPTASDFDIKVADGATASTPVSNDGGKTWTFTVTAQDGTTKTDYTIEVTVKDDSGTTPGEGEGEGGNTDDNNGGTTPPSSTTGGGGFSGTYNYPVSTPTVDNGTVKLSDNNATAGETVTATVKPDKGYGVAEVIVTDSKGNVIPVTYLGNGEYSFVMPAGKVNIETVCKPAITLTIGSQMANVFGKNVKNDVAPIITAEGRTMLPIRFIAEALGADVSWNADTQTVTITKDGVTVQIIIGADYAYINGKKVKLDAKAFIANGRTYLPVRFISEALGADVNWDAVTRQVVIIK